jgi:exonuclease SbcD
MTMRVPHINQELVEDFDLVLSGHYHNKHRVYQNTYHLPSICQNNFGEDYDKGFTILYNDLQFETVNSEFKMYRSLKWNCDVNNPNKIVNFVLKEMDKNPGHHFKIQITGSKVELESLDVTKLKEAGVKVEKIPNDVERTEISQEVVTLTHQSMIDKFKDFCEQEGLDFEKGMKYLKQIEE